MSTPTAKPAKSKTATPKTAAAKPLAPAVDNPVSAQPRTVAVVAPFFQDNTIRYLRAFANLPNCRTLVISQDPMAKLPGDLQSKLAGHWQVRNSLAGRDLGEACVALQKRYGPLDGLHGFLEQLQVPLGEARDIAGLPGMNAKTALQFRDKSVMKDVLRAAGVPVARHALVESDGDALDFANSVGFPLILKPVDGLGSRGTQRIDSEAQLASALKQLRPSLDRPLQAEEFVTGAERTFETVSVRGEPLWDSGTWYMNRPLEVLENPWMQYCVVLPKEEDRSEFTQFRPTNRAALRALGMGTGLTHMEWFLRKDGSHVVSEVGARPPGVHIMPMNGLALERDFVSLWANLVVHEAWPSDLQRKWAVGAAFFRGTGKGLRVTEVKGLDTAQQLAGSLVVDRKLPTVGQLRADGYEGEGWAIVRAPRTEQVVEALKALVTNVQVRYGQ